MPRLVCLNFINPKITPPRRRDGQDKVRANEIAEVDQDLRRRRQLRAEVLVDTGENRDDLDDQEQRDRKAMKQTITGYDIADFTFFFRRAVDSR